MKKSILNIGKILNKTEQQQINGGIFGRNPCNGCPYNPFEHCCIQDTECETTTVITANSIPNCL